MRNNLLKWLYPHLKIKRWFFISLFGALIIVPGAIFAVKPYPFVNFFGVVFIICGIFLIVLGVGKMIVSFIALFLPEGEKDIVEILYQRRYLERGPKIVAIGGGHGLSNLIFGLKEYTSNITAVVTVADSGGSSGMLREEFNIVAPGDIRNCLVALADAPALMGDLFQFRFSKDSQLKGHNFGNLFLTAMVQLTNGDFEKAVKECSQVLAIRGKVLPSTVSNVHLVAEYKDGSKTEGEAKIPRKNVPIERVFLNPKGSRPTQDSLESIAKSDIIVLGPGSLYTSVLPNLIIDHMAEAIAQSSAFKIYVCNVMTQQGETEGYKASDHIQAIVEHTNRHIVDACIINNAVVPEAAQSKYLTEDSVPVVPDIEKIEAMGYKVIATDLLSVNDYVRHDSQKLTSALIKLIESQRVIKR